MSERCQNQPSPRPAFTVHCGHVTVKPGCPQRLCVEGRVPSAVVSEGDFGKGLDREGSKGTRGLTQWWTAESVPCWVVEVGLGEGMGPRVCPGGPDLWLAPSSPSASRPRGPSSSPPTPSAMASCFPPAQSNGASQSLGDLSRGEQTLASTADEARGRHVVSAPSDLILPSPGSNQGEFRKRPRPQLGQ